LLAQELISDPNVAVLEFVKNGYDAGAERVLVRFSLTDEPTSVLIADDGVGMDLEAFQQNWMHPGFSAKSPDAPAGLAAPPDTPAGKRQANRIPVGEKGLGRLAAGRLGDVMEVFTRASPDSAWLHVWFEWSDFEDMTRPLDEVEIPYEYVESLPIELDLPSGTVVMVRELSRNWKTRIPGRKALGRSDTRLGRLKEDLQLLVRPLGIDAPEFTIELASDYLIEEDDVGLVTPQTAAETAGYRFEFDFSVDARGKVAMSRRLERSAVIAEQFARPATERLGRTRLTPELAKREGRPSNLDCGPFKGVFLYNPPPSKTRAREEDIEGHGVLLYRDGILVEPYGLNNDDWLGVAARKAQRQGYALQPATLWGEVHIGRDDNPHLRDMANRQGLIETEASVQFLRHVRAEFRFFESLISPELEQRWTPKAEKARELASDRLRAAQLRSTAFTHAVRQPMLGLGAELYTLEVIVEQAEMPDSTRQSIQAVIRRMEAHLAEAERHVKRFSRTPVPDFSEVSVRAIVEGVVTEERAFAKNTGVLLTVNRLVDRTLVLPTELVHDALAELVRNAVEVERPEGRKAQVSIDAIERGNDIVVRIRDNGPGMPGVEPGTPIGDLRLESTSGRPPEGLASVTDLTAFFAGRAVVSDNGPDGAEVELHLPGRLSGLEED
jgi:signal transduction histidine kinase